MPPLAAGSGCSDGDGGCGRTAAAAVVQGWDGGARGGGVVRVLPPRPAPSASAATLTEAQEAVSGLEELVLPCLGPDGALRTTVGMTGAVGFTANGAALLRKMRAAHPLARYTLGFLDAFAEPRGDGSVRWVALLGAVLRHTAAAVDAGAAGRPCDALTRLAASLPAEAEAAAATASTTLPPAEVCAAAARAVLSTCSGGGVAEALERVVAGEYLRGFCQERAAGSGLAELPASAHNVRTVVGPPVARSGCVDGIVVEGTLRHPQMPRGVRGGPVLLLAGRPLVGKGREDADDDDDGAACGGDVSYEMTVEEVAEAAEWATLRCKMFAAGVAGAGAAAVLSGVPLPDAALAECAGLGLMVSDTVDPADVTRLADALGVSAVEPSDVALLGGGAAPADAAAVAAATAQTELVDCMRVAGAAASVYLRVVPARRGAAARTLLIAAPTPGLAADYAALARRCIAAARTWLLGGGRVVGGCWQGWLAAARRLRRVGSGGGGGDRDGRLWRAAAADALEDVACAGVRNSLGGGVGCGAEARGLVRRAAEEGAGVVSVAHVVHAAGGGAAGVVDELVAVRRDPAALGIIEAAGTLPELLGSVLGAAAALARIDGLVACRRLSSGDRVAGTGSGGRGDEDEEDPRRSRRKRPSEHVTQTHEV